MIIFVVLFKITNVTNKVSNMQRTIFIYSRKYLKIKNYILPNIYIFCLLFPAAVKCVFQHFSTAKYNYTKICLTSKVKLEIFVMNRSPSKLTGKNTQYKDHCKGDVHLIKRGIMLGQCKL